MISVLMPIFNAEDYICYAVESILSQTYEDFELIAINDGSTDKTLDILKAYEKQDSRINLITHENKGLNYSLNEGLSNCKGQFIARMDADDIADFTRFEKQISFMQDYPDIDIAGTYIELIGDYSEEKKAELLFKYNQPIDQNHIGFHLLNIGYPSHPTWLMRREKIMSIGGYSSKYFASEDYDLIMRAYKSGLGISILPEVLLKYRRYSGSKSTQQSKQNKGILDIMHIKLDYLDSRIDFNKKKVAYWGASMGGSICKSVLEERFPGIESICFFDKHKTGKMDGLEILSLDEIDGQAFDYMIGATTMGKPDILNYMDAHHKVPLIDYLMLV